jgi:RNA-directed DNA polymerase
MNRIRARVRELTGRRRWAGLRDIRDVIQVLNPALRGWGNYFCTGNASWHFQQVDRYVNQRLVRLLPRARDWRRRPFALRDWAPARFAAEFGLHRLVGTIRYPGIANAS